MLLKLSTCNLVIAMLELLPICLISLFAFENLTSKCVGPVLSAQVYSLNTLGKNLRNVWRTLMHSNVDVTIQTIFLSMLIDTFQSLPSQKYKN